MAGVALFDGDGTTHEKFVLFPVYQGFADDRFIGQSDSDRLHEIYYSYRDGRIGYNQFLRDSLGMAAAIVAGLRVDDAYKIAQEYFETVYEPYGYVQPTLEALEEERVRTILVTAEPHFVSSGLRKALGLHSDYSSDFGWVGNGDEAVFDGTVPVILTPRKKARVALGAIIDAQALSPGRSHGYGDSEGDTRMLMAVDIANCIKSKRADGLLDHAKANNWNIVDRPDLPIAQIGIQRPDYIDPASQSHNTDFTSRYYPLYV